MLPLKCNYKTLIDRVVKSLSALPNNFITSIDTSYVLNLESELGHLLTIDMYEHPQLFKFETDVLLPEPCIKRAIIISVPPYSKIPVHVDDDDRSFRIVAGIHCPEESCLVFNNAEYHLTNESIGFHAYDINHGGYNNSDKFWNMITIPVIGYQNILSDVYKIT